MHLHHHNHSLDDVHYDVSTHDNYRAHYHEWAGNNHFDTVADIDDDHHADDYQLTAGDDHQHPGHDIRWADLHSRTAPPAADSDAP